MPSTKTPAGWPDYLRQLHEIREDPQVRKLALRRAGDWDVAEDALQEAYCAMARIENPERIQDPRAYFCRVLIHEIYHLKGQLGATLADDFVGLADTYAGKTGGTPRFDETVTMRILLSTWLARLSAERQELTRKVPGRSPNADRYRAVIVSTAARLLLSLAAEGVSDADINAALRAAYPQWFAEDGCGAGNSHQRYSRARADIDRVLRTIVNRDDLYR